MPAGLTTDSSKLIWVKSKSRSRLKVAEVDGVKYALTWISHVWPV